MTIGDLGAFDDSGVTTSCVVSHQGRVLQYYTGWSLGVTVPFVLGIGCAESDDGGRTFRKVSPAPVLGRTAIDPYLTASPSVLVEGDTWRMWYVSGSDWRASADGASIVTTSATRSRQMGSAGNQPAACASTIGTNTKPRSRDRAWSATQTRTECGSARAATPTGSDTRNRQTVLRGLDMTTRSRSRGQRLGLGDAGVPVRRRSRRHQAHALQRQRIRRYRNRTRGSRALGHDVMSIAAASVGGEGFPDEAFEHLAELEDGHFWFKTRARLLVWALQTYFPEPRACSTLAAAPGVSSTR